MDKQPTPASESPESVLNKHLVPDCFNTDFGAKEYLVHVWDEIIAAMLAYSSHQLEGKERNINELKTALSNLLLSKSWLPDNPEYLKARKLLNE